MNISESHRRIIVEATKQVPSAWQTRFAEAVIDALFGQPDLIDEDIRKTCKQVGARMEMVVRL